MNSGGRALPEEEARLRGKDSKEVEAWSWVLKDIRNVSEGREEVPQALGKYLEASSSLL